MMHLGLDDEEYRLMQTLLNHYALQLHDARAQLDDLRRKLDCANARIDAMTSITYGVSII